MQASKKRGYFILVGKIKCFINQSISIANRIESYFSILAQYEKKSFWPFFAMSRLPINKICTGYLARIPFHTIQCASKYNNSSSNLLFLEIELEFGVNIGLIRLVFQIPPLEVGHNGSWKENDYWHYLRKVNSIWWNFQRVVKPFRMSFFCFYVINKTKRP